jgi:hypothetical protein
LYSSEKEFQARCGRIDGDATLKKPESPQRAEDPAIEHWAGVSDEKLVSLELQIDGPDTLPGLVTKIPSGPEEAYMEFTYDLRGTGREDEFFCVHGHHRHLHGAVMRKGDARFLVGWICAESIYGENLSRIRSDYDAAVTRRSAVLRVRDLRNAIADFSSWADQVARSGTLEGFDTVRLQIMQRFPWVFEVLQAAGGRRINDAANRRAISSSVITTSSACRHVAMISLLVQLFSNKESTSILPVPRLLASSKLVSWNRSSRWQFRPGMRHRASRARRMRDRA